MKAQLRRLMYRVFLYTVWCCLIKQSKGITLHMVCLWSKHLNKRVSQGINFFGTVELGDIMSNDTEG